MNTTPKVEELKHRVDAKTKEIESRLAELKADATLAAGTTRDKLEKRLRDLRSHTKEGWDHLKDESIDALNNVLKD